MIGSISHEISHYIPRNHPISLFPPCVFAPYQGQQLPFEISQKLPIRLRKATANLIDGTNTPELTRHRPGNQPYMFINVKEMGYEILCKYIYIYIKHLKYLEMPINRSYWCDTPITGGIWSFSPDVSESERKLPMSSLKDPTTSSNVSKAIGSSDPPPPILPQMGWMNHWKMLCRVYYCFTNMMDL